MTYEEEQKKLRLMESKITAIVGVPFNLAYRGNQKWTISGTKENVAKVAKLVKTSHGNKKAWLKDDGDSCINFDEELQECFHYLVEVE